MVPESLYTPPSAAMQFFSVSVAVDTDISLPPASAVLP